jgi:hypothetical protein
MRNPVLLLLFLSGISLSVAHAEVYRWVDATGRVVYGDNPPKKSGAKAVDLPTLTIADGYAPKVTAPETATSSPAPAEAAPASGVPPEAAEEATAYSEFKITSPTADETVRSNTGSVDVSVALTPSLKSGDGIVWYVDSKQAGSGVTPTVTLNDLTVGSHRVFAVLNDAAGNIIQNTETITFNMLRQTALPKR